MATYRITGTVQLAAEIEPQGYLNYEGGADEVSDFTDNSSFYSERCNFEGDFDFEVTAPTEDAAREIGEGVLQDISFRSDDLEWDISEIEITEIEKTSSMELAEAIRTLQGAAENLGDDNITEAVEVVTSTLDSLNARSLAQAAALETLRTEVAALKAAQAPQEPQTPSLELPGSDQ